MATRHRIPTIFNLSMVDVLCCALGCVILLWLLNLRAAKERAEAAGRAGVELAQARTDLETRSREAAEARARAEAAEKDRDAARSRIEELDRTLAALRTQRTETEERLTKKTQGYESLAQEATAAKKRDDALALLVREEETQAQTTA